MNLWPQKPKREDPRDTMHRLYGGPSGTIDTDKVWEDRDARIEAENSMTGEKP